MKIKTEPKLFIIESLELEDENDNDFEGHILSNILHLSRIENRYCYIRTKKELVNFIEEFSNLKYRFLHISCHGNSNSLATTLDSIEFKTLASILSTALSGKRLFLSACSAVNDDLANAIFKRTGCTSIVGPYKTVHFDDAAIFWSSFYQLLFKQDSKVMKRETLERTLKQLVALHKIPIKYYTASKSELCGWKEVLFK
jgi:hypothetical protein